MHKLMRDPFDDDLGSVEVDHIEEEQVIRAIPSEEKFICEFCTIPMVSAPGGGMRCKQCGYIDESEAFELDVGNECISEQYNTSENSSMATRVIGPGRGGQQRVLHSSPGASGNRNVQHRETMNKISAVVLRGDQSISQKVISDAADLFCQVQQHQVLRGGVRKGTQAACLYKVCAPNRIVRSIREIAQLFGVDQSEVSNGDKILDELYAQGLITKTYHGEDQTEEMQISDLLTRYFNSLEMNDRCRKAGVEMGNIREFCTRLVRFTKIYRIAEGSVINSKCIGSIYVLSQHLTALDIDRETIEKKCKISKSTFNRFGKCVALELKGTDVARKHVRSRLRQVFRVHEIPLGDTVAPRGTRAKKPTAIKSITPKLLKPLESISLTDDVLDADMSAD